jgi:hypothetical protein
LMNFFVCDCAPAKWVIAFSMWMNVTRTKRALYAEPAEGVFVPVAQKRS